MIDSTHTAIIGPGRSGKTSLMMAKAAAARRDGIDVMVLDPNMNPAWPASLDSAGKKFITNDVEKFYQWCLKARSCVLMIDECRESLNRDPKYGWFSTRSRHWGHHAMFGAQRWTMLLPDVRAQCDEIFCFRQAPKEAALLAEDFVDETLRGAVNLPQYHFMHKLPFLPAKTQTLRL